MLRLIQNISIEILMFIIWFELSVFYFKINRSLDINKTRTPLLIKHAMYESTAFIILKWHDSKEENIYHSYCHPLQSWFDFFASIILRSHTFHHYCKPVVLKVFFNLVFLWYLRPFCENIFIAMLWLGKL